MIRGGGGEDRIVLFVRRHCPEASLAFLSAMTMAETEEIILLDPASRARARARAGLKRRAMKNKPLTGEKYLCFFSDGGRIYVVIRIGSNFGEGS